MTTPPLPLDDCPRIAMAGIGVHLGGTVGSYVFEEAWCLHFYRYHGRLTMGGVPYDITPGSCSLMPPRLVQEYEWHDERCEHVFVHFLPGRGERNAAPIPLMQELGSRFEGLAAKLESVVRFRATRERRAEARLYDLLFSLAEISEPTRGLYSHPVMKPLLEWVDLHLAERFTVQRICREFDLSHNYLNRLFQRDLGCSIAAWVQRRRAARAIQLLTETALPVKVIAADLGYADLAQFSKLIRRHTGKAPRELR